MWSHFGSSLGSVYSYMLPGFARTALFIPAYILTYPIRFVVEKQRMDTLRQRTRDMALQGLWSVRIPICLGYLATSWLVKRMEYVRVINGEGPLEAEHPKGLPAPGIYPRNPRAIWALSVEARSHGKVDPDQDVGTHLGRYVRVLGRESIG